MTNSSKNGGCFQRTIRGRRTSASARSIGFTDADFEAMRRPYDDPRRTPSKRALLKRDAKGCARKGKPLYSTVDDQSQQSETLESLKGTH